MSYAFLALDSYNEAIQLNKILKDQHIMIKAKAKIGWILYKILKDKAKARNLFYEVTILVFNE